MRPQMMVERSIEGNEVLDIPSNNYDIAGIPREQWSSSLFHCYSHIPSCFLSICCSACLWSQIVIRAQIPVLIDFKNYLRSLRGTSGYFLFIDLYCWTLILFFGFLVGFIFLRTFPYLSGLCILIAIGLLILFVYVTSHVRTAFRMKYSLPGYFPVGSEAWDCVLDGFITCFCHPCALSQMARHVFQYDRWQPPIGFFLGDPSTLPPLEIDFRRPPEADNAGLAWINDRPLPGTSPLQGRGNAPPTNTTQSLPVFNTPQRMENRNPVVASPILTSTSATTSSSSPVYNADGTLASQ